MIRRTMHQRSTSKDDAAGPHSLPRQELCDHGLPVRRMGESPSNESNHARVGTLRRMLCEWSEALEVLSDEPKRPLR